MGKSHHNQAHPRENRTDLFGNPQPRVIESRDLGDVPSQAPMRSKLLTTRIAVRTIRKSVGPVLATLIGPCPIPTACFLAGLPVGAVHELDVIDVFSPWKVAGVEFTGHGTGTPAIHCPGVGSTRTVDSRLTAVPSKPSKSFRQRRFTSSHTAVISPWLGSTNSASPKSAW